MEKLQKKTITLVGVLFAADGTPEVPFSYESHNSESFVVAQILYTM